MIGVSNSTQPHFFKDPCNIRITPQFLDVWYSQASTIPTSGDRLKKDANVFYFAQRSTLNESSDVPIPPQSEKSVNVRLKGMDIITASPDAMIQNADTMTVCPIIRYRDIDNNENIAICDGYTISHNLAKNQIGYSVPDRRPFRLLPHSLSTECTRVGKEEVIDPNG